MKENCLIVQTKTSMHLSFWLLYINLMSDVRCPMLGARKCYFVMDCIPLDSEQWTGHAFNANARRRWVSPRWTVNIEHWTWKAIWFYSNSDETEMKLFAKWMADSAVATRIILIFLNFPYQSMYKVMNIHTFQSFQTNSLIKLYE